MNQTISPLIHVIPDRETASAVFFFGFPASQFPRELIEIQSVSSAPGGHHYRHAGRVFGGEPGTPLALVIRAGPGTMIEISPSERTSDFACPLRLLVGDDLKIEPANTRQGPLVASSIAMNVPSSCNHDFATMSLTDGDLLGIFANPNLPRWLRAILDAQLVYWNKHHAETYYQLTPWPVKGAEYARCVRAAPYWAMARWKRELFPSQIAYCIRRSPAGAVAFAIERIPVVKRKSLIFRFAGEALAHAADKLTDDEILTCATRNPYAVLRHRRKFLPASRAKMLAQVVPMVRMPFSCASRDLETDILESLALFPSVWLEHYQSFGTAMDTIASHLSIIPDGSALLNLQKRMAPAGRDAFFHFMAHRI